MRWFPSDIDYPLFVVTVTDGQRREGCLIGFATQSSVDPLLFTVFLSDKNRTSRLAHQATMFAVHLVPEDRKDLAELFGGETGDEIDKFARCEWRPGPGGVPIVDGCSSWFAASPVTHFASGDHIGFILSPVDGAQGDTSWLGFQSATDIAPGHEA